MIRGRARLRALECGEEVAGAIAEVTVREAQLVEVRSAIRLGSVARRHDVLAGAAPA